jgi:hypothetical protein
MSSKRAKVETYPVERTAGLSRSSLEHGEFVRARGIADRELASIDLEMPDPK